MSSERRRASRLETENAIDARPHLAGQLHHLLQPAVPAGQGPRLRRQDHRLHAEVAAGGERRHPAWSPARTTGAGAKGAGDHDVHLRTEARHLRRHLGGDARRAGRSRRPSSTTSRPSTSSTARSAPSSTTTCRRRATPAARSPRAASSRPSSSTRWTTTSATRTGRTPTSISYAAGHKAMGLYAMWALRDEVARVGRPGAAARRRRRSACASRTCSASAATRSPRRRSSAASAPGPSTGTRRRRRRSSSSRPAPPASASPARSASRSAPRDRYGADAPRVHVVEGEGGLTPGRVAEALAAAGTASLDNVVVHVDWNQASIDSRPRLPRGRRARRLRAVGPARSSSTCTTGT